MSKKHLLFLSIFFTFAIFQHANAAKSLLQANNNFPTTTSDTSFTTRTENSAQGYTPFAGRSAYQTIDIESEEAYLERMIRREELQSQRDAQTMPRDEYCDKYPLDDKLCPQYPGLEESVIAIGNRKTQTPQQPVAQTPTQTAPIIPNKASFNGPCTPPQRSKIFVNKILTSGQYAQSDPAFEKAMITVFRTEGECSNDPDDAGGYTCYGISQKNNPEVDVRNITRADAERIGYNKYYVKYNMNTLPDNLRGNVFMLGWASGPATAVKKFCKFLKIPERTKIDENIVSAATSYPGDIHNDFLDDQQNWYIQASKKGNNKKFLKGWMNRVQLMRENGCHTPTTDPITR